MVVLLCLAFSLAWPVVAIAHHDNGVLVLGCISDDPKAHYEQLKPLLDYVVPRMASVGIREGRVLMAKDAQQMASYLRRGRVDWVTETAGTGMLLNKRADARPLLLTERDGTSQYHTLFFARRDSGLRSLKDLRSRRVAFQRPTSTSAYFVPAVELLHQGLNLEVLASPTEDIGSDVVGYLFARSELNIATWVHKGLVDVGVISNLDWGNPRRVPPSFQRDFVIIHKTADYPRAVELVREDMHDPVRDRLAEVLMAAASDPDASEALLRFFKTTRFLPIDPASQRRLQQLAEGIGQVRAEVE